MAKSLSHPSDRALTRCEADGCDNDFEPKRSTARFCSATCRQRAARQRKAAIANAEDESKTDTPAEHGLVKAVRLDLEKAKAIDTVPGQLALQFARRMANPDETGLSAMSKELRLLLAEARAESQTSGGGDDSSSASTPADAEPDEVTKARRKREEIEAAAAAEAEADA